MEPAPHEESEEALEARLQAARRKYALLLEHTRDGLWIIDAKSRTTLVNPRMEEMLGYPPDEMLGMPLEVFMDERGKAISDENLERRRQGVQEQHDFEFLRKDGSRAYLSLETSPIFDADGTYEGAVAFVSDVSERRRTDEEQRHLAAIVACIGDGVVSAGIDGVITSWNPSMESMLGFTEEEALRMRIFTMTPPRVQAESKALIGRILKGAQVIEQDTYRLHKDGHEVSVAVTISPLRDADGEITGVAAIFRDNTERTEAQRAVDASHRLLQSIIDSAGEGIFVKGADLRYQLANQRAARLLGMSADDLQGKADDDFMAPEIATARQERDRQVMRDGQPLAREYVVSTGPDGEEAWVAETKAPLFDSESGGTARGVVGVLRDITDQRNAEEARRAIEAQMLQMQKLKSLGLLAGGIAHDFNNLLVAILGNADLAASELPAGSPVQEELADIVTASRRASELCRQLLAYAGRGRFVIEQIDLSDAVREISALLKLSLSKRATMQLALSETPVVVEADATQIRQVFMNLITNASEAVDDAGGVIRVTTGLTSIDEDYLESCVVSAPESVPGTYAFVEVSDTGCGMARAKVETIFDPFVTSKFTGRGLGLAAVAGIARGHGGAIRVYTELGRGSSFKVLFPVCASEQSRLEQPSSPPQAKRGVVLVIDDEASVLQFAGRALARLGYEVVAAGGGEEGVERFRADSSRFVAVLLDMTMPGMDGRETFSALRKIDEAVPIILSSGFNEQESTDLFAGRELAGFLSKPYSVSELEACLAVAIQSTNKP